jgi:hypothetical protein
MSDFKWSFSAWNTYDQCPRKYKYQKIDKLPDPTGPAAARGVYYHAVAEGYVAGTLTELPQKGAADECDLTPWQPLLDELRDKQATVEVKMAFDREWEEVKFFSPTAWVRVVYDLNYYEEASKAVVVADWKTGRINRSHDVQLDLYMATALLANPQAEVAWGADHYLDIGPKASTSRVLGRRELPATLIKWEARAARMENDTQYRATPSTLCGWCSFSALKGGPCEAG